MHPALAGDLNRLPDLLQAARDLAAQELSGLDERPAVRLDQAPDPEGVPGAGAGAEGALARFAERWAPGFSGSAGPRYLGFVTGGATPASVAGDWLTSAYDQNASGAVGSWAAAQWLNVPYDAAVQFTRRQDLQIAVFHNASPYLGLPTGDPDFLHLTPENSRRLRALPAWFSLVAYGRAGHREIVERNIALARELGARIEASDGLRLLAPVRLNVVCFTLDGGPTQERIDELARSVAESGDAFLTPTVYDGVPALRAAFSNWRTTGADVERVTDAIASARAVRRSPM